MDYKYITQLLERYWQAETTVEEENILRAFFSQTSIPEELEQYRCLFLYEATQSKTDTLGSDFDSRMLALVGGESPPHHVQRAPLPAVQGSSHRGDNTDPRQRGTVLFQRRGRQHSTRTLPHRTRHISSLQRLGNHRHAPAAQHGHLLASRQQRTSEVNLQRRRHERHTPTE